MLARLLRGMRDGAEQAGKLLANPGTNSNPEARGKAAGIMQAQVAMIDSVLPQPCAVETIKDGDKGGRGGAGT